MIVTDKEYFLEKRLVQKLDLMITRLRGSDDNVVLIDGDEGQGKTNLASGICYYVSQETGRKYTVDNIFFSLDDVINFASSTKEKIIHWDEAAFGGMASQWWNKNQLKFMQLVMTARKKKHFLVICIPRFYKLNEYLCVDRSIGLIHVYARRNIQKGRMFYYNKIAKEKLYDEWKRKHKRAYKKFKTFHGSFPKAMEKIFSPEEIELYEEKKDKAILSLNGKENEEKNIYKEKLLLIQYRVSMLPKKITISGKQLMDGMKINPMTIKRWREIPDKYPEIKKKLDEKEN
jgi:hypothetical protein